MSLKTNRRAFLFQSLKAAGGLAAVSSTLAGCSTFDEYLFEDTFFLKDQVVIIGGGLSGLHLAYRLRQNKNAFRLFEGSSRLGGRIRSNKGYDYGASLYTAQDETLKSLIQEMSLATTQLEKNKFYLTNGMQGLIDSLLQRTEGLITYRSIRLRWKLISIQKINHFYEVVFEGPSGRRTYVTKKIALAIPPTQWNQIAGLYQLPEMKPLQSWAQNIRKENTMKVILTNQQGLSLNTSKALTLFEDDEFSARQIIKTNKSISWLEMDIKSKKSEASIEIDKINSFIKKRMNVGFSASRMTEENYFDWNQIQLIQGAAFKNPLSAPEIKSSSFQVIGDFTQGESPGTLETALLSSIRGAEYLT